MLAPSILIVDDEPDNFDVIETFLGHQDYQLHYAANGEEAIATLTTFRPDLILLDVMMPGLDGFEVCQRIKACPQWQIVPIIMVTALATKEDLAKCLEVGADDFISKPVNRLELSSRVRSMLRIHQQYLDNQQLCLELEATNDSLQTALVNLKNTQAQLIHQEQLALTGQMMSGLAHEINNPISFILGNLEFSHEYANTLLRTVKILQEYCPKDHPDIQTILEDADLDFIRTDFPKILSSMNHGAERIQHLILNIRNFTRLDEATLKSVNLHQGLDNTLLLLQPRLSPSDTPFEITVVREYGILPKIECYAASLNLVFLNILTNAIDALERRFKEALKNTLTLPQIKITTQKVENQLVISIADNGPGMTPNIAQKMFEPFFTTKPIGQGLGLSLAICSQIVIQQHQGELECSTLPDQGTKVIIRLPLKTAQN